MDDSASAPAVWSLDGEFAQLEGSGLASRVDVAQPKNGLACATLEHVSSQCTLFRVRRAFESSPTAPSTPNRRFDAWPLPLAEAYVRGNDLVASYQPTDEWPYAPQLYWQANSLGSVDGMLASLSLLISVQTHLLDTHPQIQVVSELPVTEMFLITIGEGDAASIEPVTLEGVVERTVTQSDARFCVLWRPISAPVSYIEIASASDIRGITVELVREQSRPMRAQWHLFAEFLEKGVIRRARVHGAILPRANDTELALECCRVAQQSPLPLTT